MINEKIKTHLTQSFRLLVLFLFYMQVVSIYEVSKESL